ncbi:CHASE2 domain-containing protein [Leptolyngbya sp. AN02str]|uniref:CHASE2 domain-containing protein n=1 Tax=Leptolyngbya sp. AN02str TaxID=3423363 RepID=UPI003D318063
MVHRITESIRKLTANPNQLRTAIGTLIGTTVLTGFAVTGLIAIVRQLGGLQGAELAAYDTLVRLRPDEGTDERILVVGIDEFDIQARQEFPIHDGTLAELLQRLQAYEPRAIGVDIARDIPQGEGREAMTQQFASSDRIISSCVLSSATSPGLPPAPGATIDQIAFADLPQDSGNIIRRSILVSTPIETSAPLPNTHVCNEVDPENQLPSLAFVLGLIYLSDEGVTLSETPEGELQLGEAVLHRLPMQTAGYHYTGADDYQILLNYRTAAEPFRTVNLSAVLSGQVDESWVRDRIVLIGYESDIAKDRFVTPLSGSGSGRAITIPGVTIHAHSVSNLISAALGERSLLWYWPRPIEGLWMLGWALVGGAVAYGTRRLWHFVVLEGLVAIALLGSCYVLLVQGGWVPLVPAAIGLVLTGVSVALLDRATQEGYTQAIYEQVRDQVKKVVAPPSIEIDENKRAQQVAEITESSYFQDLKARAKAIREQRQSQLNQAATDTSSSPNPPST